MNTNLAADMISQFNVRKFVNEYEFRTEDGGYYAPSGNECALLEDALNGALYELSVKVRAAGTEVAS